MILIYPDSALRHGANHSVGRRGFLVFNRSRHRVPYRRRAGITPQMMPRLNVTSYLHKDQRFNLS